MFLDRFVPQLVDYFKDRIINYVMDSTDWTIDSDGELVCIRPRISAS